MSSNLTVREGIYDPSKRFAFKNIDKDDFVFTWGGNPIKVKAGETIELPHHLAVLATKNLVDKIMLEEIRVEEVAMREKKQDPYWRSPRGGSVGVPAAREVYEKQILRELEPNEESPQMQVMRAQIREEIQRDLAQEKAPKMDKVTTTQEEFAEVNVKRKK